MKPIHCPRFLAISIVALVAHSASAATITKAASGTDLNDGASWVDGVVPAGGDIATWDSSSLCTGLTMATYLPSGGISVGSASSDIDISGGGWLSLGGGGIDMSASTVNLTLGTTYGIDFSGSSTWTVNAGKTLTVGTTPASVGLYAGTDSILTVGGAGNTVLNAWGPTTRYTLTKTGTGTLTTGSQLRIAWGNVNVQDGVLSVQSSQLIDANYYIDSGAITVSGGGVLELQNWEYGAAYNLGGLRWNNDAVVFNGGTIRMNNTADTASTNRGRGFTIQAGGATLEANGGGLWMLDGVAPDNSANGALTLSGSGNGQMDKSLPGTAATATLTKSGTGTWTLTGANTYVGNTTITTGTLALVGTGSISSSPTIQVEAEGTLQGGSFGSGQTVQGTGTLAGSITMASGSILAPAGDAVVGDLVANGALTLAGDTHMDLHKSGATLTNDRITGTGSLVRGGTLTLSFSGDDLAANDSFTLLTNSGGRSGGFTAIHPPSLPEGLSWDMSNFAVNGSIQVVDFVGTPSFTPPAGNYVGAQSVTITSDSGATIYYTVDGSVPTTSSPLNGLSPITGISVPTDSSMTIRAIAVKSGQADSPEVTATYNTVTTAQWNVDFDGNWSDATNWLAQVIPDGSDVPVDFHTLAQTGNSIVTLDGNRTVGSMTFGNTNSFNWTLDALEGKILTLATSSGTPAITVLDNTTTLSAPLAGTQGLRKEGPGTLTLTNANTYTGTTTLNAGILQIGAGSTSGTLGSGAIAVNAGVLTFDRTDTPTIGSAIAMNGGAIHQLAASTVTLSGDLTLNGAGSLTAVAGGTLIMGATPSSNRILFNGNTLSIGGEGDTVLNTWGSYESGTLTKTGSGTLTTTSQLRLLNSNVNVEGGVLSVQSWQLYAGYSHSFSGAITLSGGGVLELQNWNYGLYENLGYLRYDADAIVINGGTIQMNNTAATGDGRGFTIGSGGATLDANGGNNLWLHTGGAIDNTANGALTLTGSGLGQLDMVFSGTGALTKSGTGTWTLTGANTYSGDTTINNGTLEIGGAGVLATTTLVSNIGTLAFNSTAAQTLTNGISGEGGILTKSNTGTLTLNGANTYTGVTTVSGGRLNVNNTHASSVTVGAGATLGGTGSMAELLTLNEGSALALDGTSTIVSLTSNGVNFAGPTSLVFDGTPVTGTYDVVKYGAGGVANFGNLIAPLTFRATLNDDEVNHKVTVSVETGTRTWNTTSGTWAVAADMNFLEGDFMFYNGDAVVFNDPATASTVTLSEALLPISVTFNHANEYILSGLGSITGAATLTKNGTGTLTLATANTYTGTTTVIGGVLIVNGSLGNTAVTVDSTATLGGTGTLGGNVTYSSGALALFSQVTPLTVTGTLTLNDNVVHLVLPTGLGSGTYPLATYNPTGSTGTFAATPVIDSGSLVDGAVAAITMAEGTVSLTVSLYYDAWKNDTFANGTLSDKALGGDPDGDQHTNLEEYAFGTDPTVSSSSSIAYTTEGGITAAGQPVTGKVDGNYYAVFGRRLDYVAAGLTYTVEFSAGLDIWVANDDLTNPPQSMCTGNGTIDAMGVRFPATLNFDGVDRTPTFFRLKVESH